MRRITFATLLAGLALAACGGSGAKATNARPAGDVMHGAAASCAGEAASATLRLSAKNMKYSASCLVAAAGVPLTLRFVNDDRGMLHNVQIFTANPVTTPGARSLFKGTIVTGPGSIAYAIPVLRAGTYYFHCDIHPQQMFGTLVVTR